MPAVAASGLVKRYESTCALDGVSLQVAKGEVRGLLGPNGAGKTTLLRLLFGLLAPDEGEVELLGRPLVAPHEVSLHGVAGFVEDPRFYPYLSGRANLELLSELDDSSAAGLIEAVLERVDLTRQASDRVSGYSTGMRQRLGIAAALLRAPRLLLLDEPTSGLDPMGARDVAVLVRELATQGVAVLLSSHRIGELEKICDSYTVLHRGRVMWDGTAPQLREQAPGSAYALSTRDDSRAKEMADRHQGVRAAWLRDGGLALAAGEHELDGYVMALGQEGIPVRRLEMLVSPLESMFFALTSDTPIDQMQPDELAERALALT